MLHVAVFQPQAWPDSSDLSVSSKSASSTSLLHPQQICQRLSVTLLAFLQIVSPISQLNVILVVAQVWKRGTKVRVDGTLMGLDQKSSVPKFKRGHFSVLFDAAAQPASLVLADHGKGTFLNMTKERKQRKPDIDSEVRILESKAPSGRGQLQLNK